MAHISSAIWVPPSSSSSPNAETLGLPVEILEEHVRALRQTLANMSYEEQFSVQQEIQQVQWQIEQIKQQKPENSSAINGKLNFESASQTYGHSQGSASNSDDSSLYYTGGSRKRQRGLLSENDYIGTEYEVKSPRFTPSPRTFASTPLSGSPGRNGYSQNDDAEMARLLQNGIGPSTPSYHRRQPETLSDEEMARRLQDLYNNNNGYTPPNRAGPFRHVGNAHPLPMQPPVIATSPPLGHGAYNYSGNVIELLSSDDEEDFVEIGVDGTLLHNRLNPRGQRQATKPETLNELGYGYNLWSSPVASGLSPYNWPLPTGHNSAQINNYHTFRSISLGGNGSMLEPSQQIVDQAGNVLLHDNWEAPDGMNRLPGAVRSYADYVSNDPTKTLEEIKSLLENIRPDMEIPPENREGTPDAMVYPLMEHQKVGLTWLKKMEEGKTKGGILADDMGLGKTIQTLALLVSRPSKDKKCKTTLIVAPVALLKQWEREIRKKLKAEHQISVYIYHGGNKKAKTFSDLAEYDVVLTTFGTIASEFKRKDAYQRAPADRRGEKPTLMLLGDQNKFYRVVIDEAQCIKNRDTQSSKGCWSIDAQYRLCLSGTPMQNSCDELFPLLRFLRIRPYNEWSQFSQTFSKPLKNKSQTQASSAMSKIQALLKAILLRRTKTSEIDGQPILTLPPKEITIVHTVFSPDEKAFYDGLESKSKIVFNKYLRQNAVSRNYSNILVLLLRLRQACCHPHLINDIEEAKNEADQNAMLVLVNELSPYAVARIKQSESLECPVCLDVSENPSIVIPCGHLFCKECLLQVQTQHEQHNLERGEESSKLRCPGCRGELDPQKVTDLSTFKMVHPTEDAEAIDNEGLDIQTHNDDLIYDTDSDDEEVTKRGDLKDFVVRDDDDSDDDKVVTKKTDVARTKSKNKGKGKQKVGQGRTLAEVRKDAMRNEKSKRQYQKYLAKRWVDSAKVSKCVEIIQGTQQTDSTEKTIVFSQFTSLLDLLEIPISRTGFKYRRYDGGMSAAKRNQALLDFQDDESIKVLLVSLKAGNSGLNLVAASQVIIFDPFYNPFIEFQAIDRAHRIGQQRKVVVHRLIIAGTVEDRVLTLQEEKRQLIEGALDENAQLGLGRLNAKDLGFLFGIGA